MVRNKNTKKSTIYRVLFSEIHAFKSYIGITTHAWMLAHNTILWGLKNVKNYGIL